MHGLSTAFKRMQGFQLLIGRSMNTLQNLNMKLSVNASSPANISIGVNSTDIAKSTCQDSNPSRFIATSDCGSLASPYTPSRSSKLKTDGKSFHLHCGTDFYLHETDIMAFTAFTFEDCIAACSTFNHQTAGLHGNLTCYCVTFAHGHRENGAPNCYLKGTQNIPPTSDGNVDSATLITS